MNDDYQLTLPDGMKINAQIGAAELAVLTPEALLFLTVLHRRFDGRRRELLHRREERQVAIDAGERPDFLASTASLRQEPSWTVAPIPPDLQNRRVEITGPVERKMMINALNSGANVFMADFEDANSPTWNNNIQGHINLRDAIDRTITFTALDGKQYRLNDKIAVLLVRPRGWHLDEKHIVIDDEPISASLFDFGLYFFHNAQRLLANGTGPYFYLPKMESHLEARLWNDVFLLAQDYLGIPRSVIKATVLIENILAVFEMEEILFELRQHLAGLNAGRWDYIFSIIRKFRNWQQLVLPDRTQITMTAPFMRAYTKLLVTTCHKRGAHAIGGMAAFIPSRRDEKINEIAFNGVREDKKREATDGFDGTWVAHPDLVAVARAEFDAVLGDKPHQKERIDSSLSVTARELLDFTVPGGKITEKGLRHNINVAIQYMESWLRGTGAVGIYNLMEDAATAEISRAQVWQWVNRPSAKLDDGRPVTKELVKQMIPEELEKIKALFGEKLYASGQFKLASEMFERLVSAEEFIDFLTLVAYEHLA